MKKLVIFCDGTWNEPTDGPTNVVRLMQATAPEATLESGEKVPQIIRYVAGVGTHWGEWLRGGVFGYGISDAIKGAYSFIVNNYEAERGDEIYLFGFSRGAYTARSIAGFIHNLGVLKRGDLPLVHRAYDDYKDNKDPDWAPEGKKAQAFREKYCQSYPNKIKCLGVWDTVGALGAPYGEILGALVDKVFQTSFHNVTLSDSVQSAYHALSADERRWPFRPTPIALTDYHRERNAQALADPARGYLLYAEKWFPGVHCNVGGGYKQHGLSDCALAWMADCARKNGLNVAPLENVYYGDDFVYGVDLTQPIEKSQKIYYQIPTALIVKLSSAIGKPLVYPATEDEKEKAKDVTWLGEYIRPIPPGADVSALLEKMKVDPAYKPQNLPARQLEPV